MFRESPVRFELFGQPCHVKYCSSSSSSSSSGNSKSSRRRKSRCSRYSRSSSSSSSNSSSSSCFLFVLFSYSLYYPFWGNSGRLTWVRLQQPQDQRYPVLQVYAGSFRASVIHRIHLTWTTGSLTCIRSHSYPCAYNYTHGGWAHRQLVSTTFLTHFSCALDGVRASGLWTLIPMLNQLSHPVTQMV